MASAGKIATIGAVLFGCSGELAPEATPKVGFDGSDARANADASLAVGAVDAALDAFSTPRTLAHLSCLSMPDVLAVPQRV
jgi:hypothetical protein